ncbi:MAG TPA: cysteine desulfurase-like protein [Candidatus Acidoferrum sp.]|jgi:cysteine desulfurase family protein (TIGR01976 family)
MAEFPVQRLRKMFPALNRPGGSVYFDNAAGAQIPQRALDAVTDHLINRSVQRGGRYPESQQVDAAIQRGRETVALFLNAAGPDEIAFGMNATSFIRVISLAIAQSFADRREIIVTELDHEANIATWMALEREGAVIRWWKGREDGSLHLSDLEPLLSSNTRLVACTVTSNALGTIVDVAAVAKKAHAAGAELFLDCVHYAPHAPIDVREWQCDYLVCSGYKIFAPHMGFLWGRREALNALPTFREEFIPNVPPFKIEAGTFIYENVAGMTAAIEYLEELAAPLNGGSVTPASRRQRIAQAMQMVRDYEATLSAALLEGLRAIPGATVYGISDPAHAHLRVPTLCFNLKNVLPATVTTALAEKHIAIRDGHMYAPRLMKRLGVAVETGMVRASLVHYNTHQEIGEFLTALEQLAKK